MRNSETMDLRRVVACVLCVLAVVNRSIAASTGEGVSCFECSSVKQPEVCGEDFRLTQANASFIVQCDGSCFRNKTKSGTRTEYVRGCKSKGGNTFQISLGCEKDGQTESCKCNKNLCNSAVSYTYPLTMYLVTVTVPLLISILW